MEYRYVTRKELGTCPAAVDMDTGVVDVNIDVWENFDEFQRRFIFAHEEGHFRLPTDSELEADIYAINKVAGTAPKSLSRSIETLYKVGIVDDNRFENIYREALEIDYELGNWEAKKELQKLDNMSKFTGNQTPFINKRNGFKSRKRRVDGEVEPSRSHKTNGIVIGSFYLSFTNLLLLSVFIVLIAINAKLKK